MSWTRIEILDHLLKSSMVIQYIVLSIASEESTQLISVNPFSTVKNVNIAKIDEKRKKRTEKSLHSLTLGRQEFAAVLFRIRCRFGKTLFGVKIPRK